MVGGCVKSVNALDTFVLEVSYVPFSLLSKILILTNEQSDLFFYVLFIYLPFVAVFLKRGCSVDVLIYLA